MMCLPCTSVCMITGQDLLNFIVAISGLARKQLQVAVERLLGQLPDHFVDEHAVTVNKDRFRDNRDAIVNGNGTACVYDVGIRDAVALQEAQPIALSIFKVDADKDHPLAPYMLLRGL